MIKMILSKKTVLIAAVAVFVAVITIIFTGVFGNHGPVTGLATAVSKPLKTLASALSRTFESIYGNIYKYEQLLEEYESTLKELQELRENYSEANDLAAEVEELNALLGLRSRNPEYVIEKASIEGWGSTNWHSTYTINRGTENADEEISVGDSVITPYNVLIGRVSTVGTKTSTVISVLDTTFNAAVYVGESRGSATAKGDFSLMNSGYLKLDYIDDDTPVVTGDTVVTSGNGGNYPAGLVIGEVVEVFRHDTGIGRYATIRPTIPLETISSVVVITEFQMSD